MREKARDLVEGCLREALVGMAISFEIEMVIFSFSGCVGCAVKKR
jgi:hypothetical protein